MSRWYNLYNPLPGWVPAAGVILLAAWVPLLWLPALIGEGVLPFLCSFVVAGFAYLWAVKRLSIETPALWMIWLFAVLFRLLLLFTPVTLSNDVYRYIWDGHLLAHGINPYAQIVQSPLLDGYTTPLRTQVDFPWMATPYLPSAQVVFVIIQWLAPQSPFAFQLAAALFDLATAVLIMRTLRILRIPTQAVLIYLWNPLVIVEFSHGAHVDALMLFFFALALYGLVSYARLAATLSALALAAAVLVKGWPLLAAPIFVRRWGIKRVFVFALGVVLPLALFAYGFDNGSSAGGTVAGSTAAAGSTGAGWGISGPLDGRGLFGALRIYAASWNFNSGLFAWVAQATGDTAARVLSVLVPLFTALLLGIRAWRMQPDQPAPAASPALPLPLVERKLLRWSALPFGLYLLLAPTIHPWYLTLLLSLLPYFWPGAGEPVRVRRWIWPWFYFMFFEAFTYLAYSGVAAPPGLNVIQTIAYLPFWLLLLHAALPEVRNPLDLSRVS